MSFLTDADLKTFLAAMLKKDPAALESFWNVLIPVANVSAYNQIVAALLDRGYTTTQIDAWDRGAEFQRYIGIYEVMVAGGGLTEFNLDNLRSFAQRLDQLADVVVETDGVPVPADSPSVDSQVGYGTLSTAGDLFVLDPDDRRRGLPTSW